MTDVDPASPPRVPRVLVTGASGFIGRYVVTRLTDDSLEVRTIARTSLDRLDHHRRDIVNGLVDLAEGCDAIVHLAGLSDASASFADPAEYARINVIGTLNALEAARASHAQLILASSQRVYRPSIRPLPEEAPVGPIDPYGETKLQAEQWAGLYNRLYEVPVTILRLFSVYGPGQVAGRSSGVVGIFMNAARDGQPLRVRARQLRDFVDVRDVARAVELAVRQPLDGLRVCNIGTGQSTSIAELAEQVRQVVGTKVPVIVDMTPGAESYVADPRRALAELEFETEFDLPSGLSWYNQQLDLQTFPSREPA